MCPALLEVREKKALHEESLPQQHEQALRGASAVMVVGVGPCYAFSLKLQIYPEHMSVY